MNASRHPVRYTAAMLALWVVCLTDGGSVCVAAATFQAGTTVEVQHGVVVSASEIASRIGAATLERGGNAVDATVATAFALAVTHPAVGNIGGGGFMLVHPADGRAAVMIDYRETAPAAATPDMYAKDCERYGHRAVGVPGTLRGLELAHRKFGALQWRELVLPAVRLAGEGFALDAPAAESLNCILREAPDFEELVRVFGKPGGGEWQGGDRLVQADLAATLQRIADDGPQAFYRGAIAKKIAAEMRRGGGLITRGDLAVYQAKLRTPVRGTYRGFTVYGPAPPSSGGICLVQMLGMLEHYELRRRGRWSAETLHLMTEAMRRAYRDRARYLGDSDFVEIPAHLTSRDYLAELVAGIDPARATPSEALAGGIQLAAEGDSTTHFSIVDASGMAVANTYTLEQRYGSRVVVRGAGFLLNNEMGDFNPQPGVTNREGQIGTPPNTIAPGKRMLSSMTPVIVAREGKVVLVTGSPGGRTIINTVLSIVLNTLEFDMDVRAAVDAPRIHHSWFPDRLMLEPAIHEKHGQVVKRLRAMGHDVAAEGRRIGRAHTIAVDPQSGRRTGAADRRVGGAAVGY